MSKVSKLSRKQAVTLLLVAGVVAFSAYFYFYIYPSLAQVIEKLTHTNLEIYVVAFAAYCLYVFFSSLVWQRLLNSVAVKISARKALLFTWVGLFFDATVPQLGWSAEVSKTYLLSKDSKIDAAKIGASVVGQKIFVMTMSIVALAAGLTSVLISYNLPAFVTFLFVSVLALTILTLAVIYYVSIKVAATKTLLNWAIRVALVFRRRWNPEKFKGRAENLLAKFHADMECLKANPKDLILPIIFSVISFVFEISVIFLSFMALGFYQIRLDQVLIVFTLTGTLQTVGVAFFGFPEIVMTASFAALGIVPSLAFSATLLDRIVTLWFRLIISYVAFQWTGVAILRRRKSNVT